MDICTATRPWGRGLTTAGIVAGLIGFGLVGTAAPPTGGDPKLDTPETLAQQVNTELGLVASTLFQLEVPDTPGVPLSTTVTIEGHDYELDLVPRSVRADNYRLLVRAEDGTLVDTDPGPVRTLRGTVRGVPGSRVAGALLSNGLRVMISLPHVDGRYWVEPIPAGVDGGQPNEHVLYHDVDTTSPGECGTDHFPPGVPATWEQESGGGIAGGGECLWITQLACDTDHEYFLDYNSSVEDVQTQISSIINTQDMQYESEVEITHEITALIVNPFPNDPYSGTTNFSTLLNEFADEWNDNQPNIERDVAQLWTGRDFAGSVIGVAMGLNLICTDSAYCISQDFGSFGCQTDLSAHELGHLWGGNHCNCSDPPFTMNPSLTCANTFSQGTRNSLIAHRNSRNCLDNPCVSTNNNCIHAEPVPLGSTPFSNFMANTDGPIDGLCQFSGSNVQADIWFRFTAPCDNQYTVDLCGSSFDTTLAVYGEACPTTPGLAIACDDDSGCGSSSLITFSGTVGSDYLIRVGGFEGATGDGTLTISGTECPEVPGNDACGSSLPIAEGDTPFTTVGASTDGPDEPGLCDAEGSTQIEKDIWYRFEPSCTGTVTVSVCDSDFNPKIAVYDGLCPGGPDQAIACDANACGSGPEATFEGIADQIYRIRVGSTDGSSGLGSVSITCGTGAPCTGDTNGDNTIDVTDLVNVVLFWGSADPGADVNDDGSVDVSDLLLVILQWGPCV